MTILKQRVDAVIDTGSTNSVMTVATMRRLKLTKLHDQSWKLTKRSYGVGGRVAALGTLIAPAYICC